MILPPTRPASRATLPARGRDWSPTICALSEASGGMSGAAAAIPSLPFTGRVARAAGRVGSEGAPPTETPTQCLARSVIHGRATMRRPARGNRSNAMSNNDWKNTLPFKRHWAVYLLFKILVLAGAAFAAWQILRSFEVV
ncbi:hypothetical protein SS37A_15800 [Methylocystis iwaonis]|uniref:Uncharacterized protein n=1 Tax=Methylocystis iwaonis TaxID=2885079 RepID=A0ABM8E853_9HYPH|nr:hypothetical protein SS37A_15800 [Methylocystis iwaonis]